MDKRDEDTPIEHAWSRLDRALEKFKRPPAAKLSRGASASAFTKLPLLSDWEGNHIGVDLDPGRSGKVGQVINFGRDEEEKYVLFPSVVDLVEWLATEYESKRVEFDKEDKVICTSRGASRECSSS